MPEEEDLGSLLKRKQRDVLERMKILRAVGEECVVIAPRQKRHKESPPAEIFRGTYSPSPLARIRTDCRLSDGRFTPMGYERVGMIETRGEFTSGAGSWTSFRRTANTLPDRTLRHGDRFHPDLRSRDPAVPKNGAEAHNRSHLQPSHRAGSFCRQAGRIRRAYDRQIRKLEKKAAEMRRRRRPADRRQRLPRIRTEQS